MRYLTGDCRKMSNIIVRSLFWNNVSREIVEAQKSVYDKLRIKLHQDNLDQANHGAWMDAVVAKSNDDDIVIFSDIDAFPLSKEAFDHAINCALNGAVFGLAQTANHTSNARMVYAGPMFLAFKKSTWKKAGSPSFLPNSSCDAAQALSVNAVQNGIKVNLLLPTACLEPKWPLANLGLFGLGTFYENQFFHLFESRSSKSIELFKAVADDVVFGRSLQYGDYLGIIEAHLKIIPRDSFFGRILKCWR